MIFAHPGIFLPHRFDAYFILHRCIHSPNSFAQFGKLEAVFLGHKKVRRSFPSLPAFFRVISGMRFAFVPRQKTKLVH
jgi:hypothetical protein